MKEINPKYLKPYDSESVEDVIYQKWEKSGYFNPDVCIEKKITKEDAEAFSIVLPPPNVTGSLHTGHALMLTIQDIMIRQQRMLGKKTLWLPGTDHAAIATQSKVEKILEKEKIRKTDLGREEFLKKVDEFARESHKTIVRQSRKMGASLDWSREAFTLDETRQKAVFIAFKQMYNDGLIYRKHRIVNWDPKGQTTISDDEIVHQERIGKLYTFKYNKDCPIIIATTRPETKLGDTAIAVHPEGKWKTYIGQEYSFEFAGEKVNLKVVGDDIVDPEFGTGALGVTPSHSIIDWEIAERHNLPIKQVINEYGKMMLGKEGIKGEKTEIARTKIIDWLKENQLLIKEEEIQQNIATAERSGATIEPLPKLQWWIDVNKKCLDNKSLKDLMIEAIEKDNIKILPDRFEKIYFNWINNLRDWCISRQIWYGHQIPVWYKNDEVFVDIEAPKEDGWTRDEDTLDTWFSSGLWTFSTLLDNNKYEPDLKKWLINSADKIYHPTTVLETGHDIIFFWVARMILMSKYLINEIPFQNVYFHGIVRTPDGQKMSKSLGNSTSDPLDIIAKYGADALRMAMIVGNGPGQDIKLSEDKIKAYSKFGNKLWNIARFVLENSDPKDQNKNHYYEDINFKEKEQKLNDFIIEINKEMSEYKLYLVSEKLYHFVWHEFADIQIEEIKNILRDEPENKETKLYLRNTFVKLIHLLHPFMPFITEEIWNDFKTKTDDDFLMVSVWPE